MILALAALLAHGREPAHPVAWLDDQLVTWADFRTRVACLSEHLKTRPEQRWLLASPEPLDFAVALFAVWHAGRRAVIPPSLQTGAIAEVRNQADGILAEPGDFARGNEAPGVSPLTQLDPEHTFVDLYTSGSTGQPKRVAKSLVQLDAEIATLERLWGALPEPVLATVPHHHIYGLLFRLLWPLAAGRPFDNQTCTAPEFLLARLEKIGPGRIISSPSQLSRMHELIDLKRLKGHASRFFSSGGPLPTPAALQFQTSLGEAPLEILGSTETGGIAWRIQCAPDDTTWTTLPGVAVSVSEEGALTLTSAFLPDRQPLVTEDAATLLESGRFRLNGRLDRIVKIEEKRVSLADMEIRLASHPWVREAALVMLSGRRQSLGAVIVLTEEGRNALSREGRAACAQALRRHLAHWFDAVLLPRQWRYPVALPYNERGKLAATDLAAQFANGEFCSE
jgi:acyl-coenzyme A synthetase/AMP-(fatty) acid ligase